MNLSITVPVLFFPAISLTMLAYNARYLTIAGLIRQLNKEYLESKENVVLKQIFVLKKGLQLIIATQGFAIIGQSTHHMYQLGGEVVEKVKNTDLERKHLDFTLIED